MDSHPGKRGDGEVKHTCTCACMQTCRGHKRLLMDRVSSSIYRVRFDDLKNAFLSFPIMSVQEEIMYMISSTASRQEITHKNLIICFLN